MLRCFRTQTTLASRAEGLSLARCPTVAAEEQDEESLSNLIRGNTGACTIATAPRRSTLKTLPLVGTPDPPLRHNIRMNGCPITHLLAPLTGRTDRCGNLYGRVGSVDDAGLTLSTLYMLSLVEYRHPYLTVYASLKTETKVEVRGNF